MKNKKIIYLLGFILSLIILAFSYKDIALFYYVKMGNKNYYSKNYEKAIEYYEKALKIKEDYNIRINLIITDYQMKNYKKVIESPVENGFLKGNSLVLLNENNKNNPKDLEKALDYYKDNMLSDNDINIKKNYEIVQKKLNENQKNQDSNNQKDNKDNKDKKQNNNSNNDNSKDKQDNNSLDNKNDNSNNSQDNLNNDKQDQNNNNNSKDNDSKENQNNSSNNDNSSDKNKNDNTKDKQNNSPKDKENNNSNTNHLDNNNSKDSQNNNSNNENKQNQDNKNSNLNSTTDKNNLNKESQKKLDFLLKRLDQNEKQSFKNNERLIGVENNETKNKW